MMQVPSSNSWTSRPSLSSDNNSKYKKRASVVRWLDQFVDRACCAAAAGYSVGDEVLDDENSIAYYSNDEDENDYYEEQIRADQDRRHNKNNYAYASRLHQNPKSASSSVLWDAAEDSIQWLMDTHQKSTTHTSGSKLSDFDEARKQSHYNTACHNNKRRHNNQKIVIKRAEDDFPVTPASDATATTVLTGSTSCSHTTVPRGSGGKAACSPTSPTSRNRRLFSYKDRAHSTGTMLSPEDDEALWNDAGAPEDHASMLQHANSICSSNTGRRPHEVLVPQNWSKEHTFKRIQSETLPKLPFQTVSHQRYY